MKTKLQIVIILSLSMVCLMLLQAVCLGATYYLDAINGNDLNPGTSVEPWQTMAQVEIAAQTGDIVIILNVHPDTFAADWPKGITYKAKGVTQFGITWTFRQEDPYYIIGRFANGDYWVVGPVNIIGIDPQTVVGDGVRTYNGNVIKIGRYVHGSMLNPVSFPSPRGQGYSTVYDSRYPQYRQDMNAAWGVSSSNLVLSPNSSLVSTISTIPYGDWNYIKTAAVLTVLDQPAPEGSFRPPYSGTDKTVKFNKNQLDYSLLAKLPITPSIQTALFKALGWWDGSLSEALAVIEDFFEKPWIDHIPGWIGNHLHATENTPGYGEYLSYQVGRGALMLHLDYTNEQKETLLIRFVQVGIDNYGIIQSGGLRTWYGDGGCTHGRKWPIFFAGLMLDDAEMKNIGEKSGDYLYEGGNHASIDNDAIDPPSDYIHFSEDDQTYYVDNASVENCIDPSTGDYYPPKPSGVVAYGRPMYFNFEALRWENLGQPEHRKYPEINWETNAWQTAYRRTNTANSWAGWLLAAHIMGAKDLWNHNAIFDYQDRYMAAEQEIIDTGYYMGKPYGHSGTYNRQGCSFAAEMWDTYRANYPPVWPSQSENRVPIANAGQNQTVTDTDANGSEEVTLDGSASRDPDGEIVSFIWSEGGLQIATGINPTVTLSTGTHLITLTVTDNGGLTDTDTVTIKVLKGDKEFGKLPTGCYNNVFNPLKGERALIIVNLPKQARVKLVLYNTRGNRIRELADEEKEADTHWYYWDGRNDSGSVVGSGLYFVHIQAGDYKKTKKIVVVK